MNREKFNKYFGDHFFDILDQARNGITITDPNQEDNPAIYVNKAFSEIFGYDLDECLGRNCRYLQNDDRDQKNLDLIRKAIDEQTAVTTVLRNYTKSGKLIYNEVRISPIFDKDTGKLKFFLGVQKVLSNRTQINSIINDKTSSKDEYKNLEVVLQELDIFQTELLAQNEELIEKDKRLEVLNQEFSSLFHDAPVAYIVINKNLEVQKYNKIADKYFEFSKVNCMIKSLFMIIKDENIEKLVSWIRLGEYNQSSLEIDIVRKDNKKRRYKLNCKNYMVDETLLLISLNDITQIHELNTNLERRVKKEVDLKIEQEKVMLKQAKLAAMGEMIDAIAHQWLNPLTLIKLYAQDSKYVIEENIDDPLDIILKNQKKIGVQVEHLTNTLEEFRSFYRPDTSSEYLHIKELINSVLFLMKDELTRFKINCSVTIESGFLIKVIKNQFKHVILNLLSNSRDAFEENNIEQREINICCTEDEKYYIVSFTDNAGGIPKSVIDKVFEPNFTTKSESKGTGVGLYLCKQILDKFNISIDVKSQNSNTCFTIKYQK